MSPEQFVYDVCQTFLWRGGNYAYYWLKNLGARTLWFDVHAVQPPPDPKQVEAYDIYYSLFPSTERGTENQRARNDTVAAVTCLYADRDDGKGEPRPNLPQPTLIVNSGHGQHLYWILREPFIISDDTRRGYITHVLKRWVRFVGGDPAASDLARVLRLPGYRNWKDIHDVRLVTVELWEPNRLYSLDELTELIPQPTSDPQLYYERNPVTFEPLKDAEWKLRKALQFSSEFRELWYGHSTRHPSQSERDIALAKEIARYVGPDPTKVAECFLAAPAAHREKVLSRPDYVQRTVHKAVQYVLARGLVFEWRYEHVWGETPQTPAPAKRTRNEKPTFTIPKPQIVRYDHNNDTVADWLFDDSGSGNTAEPAQEQHRAYTGEGTAVGNCTTTQEASADGSPAEELQEQTTAPSTCVCAEDEQRKRTQETTAAVCETAAGGTQDLGSLARTLEIPSRNIRNCDEAQTAANSAENCIAKPLIHGISDNNEVSFNQPAEAEGAAVSEASDETSAADSRNICGGFMKHFPPPDETSAAVSRNKFRRPVKQVPSSNVKHSVSFDVSGVTAGLVLDALRVCEVLSVSELVERLGLSSDAVQNCLRRLVRRGDVVRVGRGRYSLRSGDGDGSGAVADGSATVTPASYAAMLGVSERAARIRLTRLCQSGKAVRVGRGVYMLLHGSVQEPVERRRVRLVVATFRQTRFAGKWRVVCTLSDDLRKRVDFFVRRDDSLYNALFDVLGGSVLVHERPRHEFDAVIERRDGYWRLYAVLRDDGAVLWQRSAS